MSKRWFVRTYCDGIFKCQNVFYYDFMAEDYATRMRRNTRLTMKYDKVDVIVSEEEV